MPDIKMTGATHVGRVRRANEDNFRLIPEANGLVVCDGMGGHAAGEEASQRAVEVYAQYILKCENLATTPPSPDVDELDDSTMPPVMAIRLANRSVFEKAQAQRSMRGMGTTLVSAQFHDGYVAIYHVGDSRAYRFSDKTLAQLTVDHSLLAELRAQGEITAEQERDFPERNVITRALGTHPSVQVDVRTVATQTGDWFLLCSDGLCGYIEDPEIEKTLASHYPDAEKAVNALISMANDAGGHDNVTVAIAAVESAGATNEAMEFSITVPQSSYDDAVAESKILMELGLVNAPADEDEGDTDKIKIVNQRGSDQEEGNTESSGDLEKTDPARPRKRGIWPWK